MNGELMAEMYGYDSKTGKVPSKPNAPSNSSKPNAPSNPSGAGADLHNPYYVDPTNQGQGTTANQLYELYRAQRQSQLDSSLNQAEQVKNSMTQELSQNRQQLMQDTRNRRRQQLKSGLSSSQIANEEIQSMLMQQKQASQLASNYEFQRQQFMQGKGAVDQNAMLDMFNMVNQLNNTNAAHYASSTTDAVASADKLSQADGNQKEFMDYFENTLGNTDK